MYVRTRWPEEGASRTICARSTSIIIQRSLILILILNGLARGALRSRTTSLLGEDSYYRGGIVHIRVGCSCALLVRPQSPKALWRFRASTSNSPSGRSSAASQHAHVRILIIFTLNKIFEYVEMTILSRPRGSFQSQGAFASSRKYLSTSR